MSWRVTLSNVGRVWAAASVLIGVVACGEPKPSSDSCSSNDDCSRSQSCVDGTCTETELDAGPRCVDMDDDGYGEGCSAGTDCDDTDPTQVSAERCDGMDNDCDGRADEGVLSACGDCNAACEGVAVGPMDEPFDPESNRSDSVGLDSDGALVLDAELVRTEYIWIANTTEGSVSRFRTQAPYEELGRYFTGPSTHAGAFYEGNDPSRTSVNTLGDAYVGNRNGNALTRISALGDACPDSNGDGVVTTSADRNGDGVISTDLEENEMLAWGEDDCVLWHKELDDALPGENLVRAVAAQDVEGPDLELIHHVWVGGHTTRRVAKLDGATGEVLLVTDSPVPPYGFALDGGGQLWISGNPIPALGRIDTTRCLDDESCDVPVCILPSSEGDECDSAIKGAVPTPHTPYGVTVDFEQRVWIGGYTTAAEELSPHFGRYLPTADAGSRWYAEHIASRVPVEHVVNGIAADARGFVWGAVWTGGVIRIEAADPSHWVVVDGTNNTRNKGLAVDGDGKVWSISRDDRALVITPGESIEEASVETAATSLVGPYTYSDMTGLQLRLATRPRGYYRHVFMACDEGEEPVWEELRFEADTPEGTALSFRARSGASEADLDAAQWVPLGAAPAQTSPLSIAMAMEEAGVPIGRFFMLEVALRAERLSSTEVITPRVRSLAVTHTCPTIFM